MTKEETIAKLDEIQELLEKHLSYVAITEVEDVYHEEREEVIRAFTFSRGTKETIAVLGADAQIHYYKHMGERICEELLYDMCAVLFLYLARYN